MSKLVVRASVLATVLSASGCIVFPSAPRGVPSASPPPRPLWSTRVIDGPAPAGVERAIRESGTVGRDAVAFTGSSSSAFTGSSTESASRPLVLHVAFEDTVDAPPALAFLAGVTLITVPAMQWHEVVVRGWVTDGEERLFEAHARRQVVVAWAWWGAFTPWLWTGPDGETAIDESVHAMTAEVIADLVAQHDVRPVEVETPAEPQPEAPAPAPWDAEPQTPAEPLPWDWEEAPEASIEKPSDETRSSLEAGAPIEPKEVEGDSSD